MIIMRDILIQSLVLVSSINVHIDKYIYIELADEICLISIDNTLKTEELFNIIREAMKKDRYG